MMIRKLCSVLVLLALATLNIRADEPPKELKAMLSEGEELLNKKKYVDFLKLVLHPNMKAELEKGGLTIESLAERMETDSKRPEMLKKLFAGLKKSTCELNADKTEAKFPVPKDLGDDAPKDKETIKFSLHEKKWYMNER